MRILILTFAIGLCISVASKWKPCGGYSNINSCSCNDNSTWTKPAGPCEDGSWNIEWCLCKDGTIGTAENKCGWGNFPTECTCADNSTFNVTAFVGSKKFAQEQKVKLFNIFH